MLISLDVAVVPAVALRKESVDRNLVHVGNRQLGARRSPQGERG